MSIHEELLKQGYDARECLPIYNIRHTDPHESELCDLASQQIQDIAICNPFHSFVIIPRKLVPEAMPDIPDPEDEHFKESYVLYRKLN